ncbi:beta-N-acetylhexosaminidase [Actinotalea sp. C106]|uniref:beta-N-acetylhexosaminidase n=1 Tax=Actinotalea sp. C106 TaxID=2908644 RepID=UPI002027BB41|nr:beta-N-acetylhexosaminidase [Actinotalea sp. C106]
MTDGRDVLPTPRSVELRPGAPFHVRPGMRVVAGADPSAVGTAVLAAGRLGEICGAPVSVTHEESTAGPAIVLTLTRDPRELGLVDAVDASRMREAYRLTVSRDRAEITALAAPGLLRGATTLHQMGHRLPEDRTTRGRQAALSFPAVEVVDHPRFLWRGLDLGLHPATVDVAGVKRVVAVMTDLKLDVLHLPVGEGGGEYDVEDYAEILTYALARHVTVVPEVRLPVPEQGAGTGSGLDGWDETWMQEVLGRVLATTPGPALRLALRGAGPGTADPSTAGLVARAAEEVHGAGKLVVGAAALLGETAGQGTVLRHVGDGRLTVQEEAAVGRGARLVLAREGAPLDGSPVAGPGPSAGIAGLEAVLPSGWLVDPEPRGLTRLAQVATLAEVAWAVPGRQRPLATRLPGPVERWRSLGLLDLDPPA